MITITAGTKLALPEENTGELYIPKKWARQYSYHTFHIQKAVKELADKLNLKIKCEVFDEGNCILLKWKPEATFNKFWEYRDKYDTMYNNLFNPDMPFTGDFGSGS